MVIGDGGKTNPRCVSVQKPNENTEIILHNLNRTEKSADALFKNLEGNLSFVIGGWKFGD